jgi:hypothetical protein
MVDSSGSFITQCWILEYSVLDTANRSGVVDSLTVANPEAHSGGSLK